MGKASVPEQNKIDLYTFYSDLASTQLKNQCFTIGSLYTNGTGRDCKSGIDHVGRYMQRGVMTFFPLESESWLTSNHNVNNN